MQNMELVGRTKLGGYRDHVLSLILQRGRSTLRLNVNVGRIQLLILRHSLVFPTRDKKSSYKSSNVRLPSSCADRIQEEPP